MTVEAIAEAVETDPSMVVAALEEIAERDSWWMRSLMSLITHRDAADSQEPPS
jgi:hypothetical protein